MSRHAAASVLLDVSTHASGGHTMVELEPAAIELTSAEGVLDLVEAAAEGFDRTASVRGLCDRAATAFRSLAALVHGSGE